MQPFVSILTPTYNRRAFIPQLIQCIKHQTYPRARLEWVILDDGADSVWDLLAPHKDTLNIQYIRSEEKLNIGAKRNRLHAAARGEILVNMDDDDYYPPERVAYAVNTLRSSRRAICGSTTLNLYFTDDRSIWTCGPFGANHATFGTMAYTKQYALAHRCDESVLHAEEIEFTGRYKEPLAQLDPQKVMLVICHTNNTYDKRGLRDANNPSMRKTALKLTNFVRSATLRDFYKAL
jgi:glycosyltransferase involved in cell wall biosynthesis